jgi:hypothetical protein
MSIDRCDSCNDQVDTDKDDECYTYGRGYNCVCKRCRELELANAALCEIKAHSTSELPAISREEAEARCSSIPPDS